MTQGELLNALSILPSGQWKVCVALVAVRDAPTYREVAERLGVSRGTVSRHLRRVRERHPDLYRSLMALRREQLAARHAAALKRRQRRSTAWHRRRRAREFRDRFGYYPWELASRRQYPHSKNRIKPVHTRNLPNDFGEI